ncbi:TetR/AcrR family transcriptional regulator [Paraburkholderia bryophila]|uniref:AcrR family transcriptional regulator n=1 Tax=Paraburkholderia bryophila TaxID=420952 RepID=A0A7Y9WRR7_9BURK|nr:TetR/AcrR family transcriptional regulator [Paraburkholderia bryophila]NYH25975.1 AcrR family transcriptional regulator [Paraburkholderia bryophila]
MSKTTNQAPESPSPGQRGSADHERRHQIIAAADEHFRLYGYRKTSVADLGKAIGVSSTYLYRFFSSKQAIGEAVCATVLERMEAELRSVVDGPGTATQRLRRFMQLTLERSLEIFFDGTRLHELVISAMEESWGTATTHESVLLGMTRELVQAGRSSGEFERKTPIDEVVVGISEAMRLFAHPVALQFRPRDQLEAALAAVSSLVLRSLAP